jgi:hypothetical protein
MNTLQSEYKKIYPKAPFKTKLIVNNRVKNEFTPNDTASLFSGGLDSTFCLYRNINLDPRLIMILGVYDIPSSNFEFQEMIRGEYLDFAEREGLKLNFIHTNAFDLMNHDRLRHFWGRFQGRQEGDYWSGIGYSLGHIGQVAPLSTERFRNLLTAAPYDASHSITEHPDASSPETDETISWANLKVKHYGRKRRHEKVKILKPLLENKRITLRVCWADPEYLLSHNLLNCSKCEKCLRTIAALTLFEIDPNDCGFNVDNSTFKLMRFLLTGRSMSEEHIKTWYKPLQTIIPAKIESCIYGSKQFFEWFKEIDLDNMRKSSTTLLSLYLKSPFFISQKMKKLYERFLPTKRINQPIQIE